MNERIRELKQQATIEHPAGHGIVKYEFSPELFAELIIQECGVALSPMLRDMVSRGQAYDLIKQHFGVE